VKNMFCSLRVLFAAALFALPFTVASAATAQTCAAPLDAACAVDHAVEPAHDGAGDAGAVGDAASGAAGEVGDAASNAANAANDAAHAAHAAVHDAVSQARRTVDDALHDGGIDPPIGPVDGDGGGGQHLGGLDGHAPTGGGHPGGRGRAGVITSAPSDSNVGASTRTSGARPARTDGLAAATMDPATRPDVAAAPPTVRQVTTGVITGVAMMALLIGAVAAFLSVQDRLDRRDPKLVPAAIGSDRVRFS
jgi:hypothetical protein